MRDFPNALLSTVVVVFGMFVPDGAPARGAEESVKQRLGASYRLEKNGWVYVHLEGPPEQIGYQHGYWLSAEIEDLLRVLKPLLKHGTRRDWEFYRDASERMLWTGIDPEYQREIDGIVAGLEARGVKADRWDVVASTPRKSCPITMSPGSTANRGRRRRPRPPVIAAPSSPPAGPRKRPDRDGPQQLEQLRRRRAGTSSSTSFPRPGTGFLWTGTRGGSPAMTTSRSTPRGS